jgi:hypothetical protein
MPKGLKDPPELEVLFQKAIEGKEATANGSYCLPKHELHALQRAVNKFYNSCGVFKSKKDIQRKVVAHKFLQLRSIATEPPTGFYHAVLHSHGHTLT